MRTISGGCFYTMFAPNIAKYIGKNLAYIIINLIVFDDIYYILLGMV